MGALARAAGVSQGLLYTYFPSKEALLRSLVEEGLRQLPIVSELHGTPVERLDRLVRVMLEDVGRRVDFWRLLYGLRMRPSLLASSGSALSSWTAEFRRSVARAMEDLGASDPSVDAELFFAALDGVAQHYVMEPNRYPVDAVARRLVAAYIRSSHEEEPA